MSIFAFTNIFDLSSSSQARHPARFRRFLVCGSLLALALASPLAAQLSEYETEQILFLKEEEKLARDVYTTLGLLWDVRVFQNIARSEQVHMDQVDSLLVAFGLEDPALEAVGQFQNPVLQHLYDRLTTEGALSLRSALGVGEFIEVIDIKDLEDLLTSTAAAPIIEVAERLKSGSINHLGAFRRQLDLLADPFAAPDPDTDLVNLSARGIIGGGESALIGGFVIEGTDTLQVLLTVRGPTLTQYGVVDAAQDPAVRLFRGDLQLAENDNWSDGASDDLTDWAQTLHFDAEESAILLDLPAGAYTFVSENRGLGSIGLVEVYSRARSGTDARMVNLSVRGQTEPGEGCLIAGFVIQGTSPMPVAVRALGPTLAEYGVENAVERPVLQIFQEDGSDRTVDDWIHDGVLGVVGVDFWPESFLEPLEVLLQQPGTVTVHAIDEAQGNGIVMVDLSLLEP